MIKYALDYPIRFLRKVAMMEGVSFIVLLLVAMPLKYLAGLPAAVKVVGMIHGVLFILFCLALGLAHYIALWPWYRTRGVLIAAFIPFGPWLIDKRMQRYDQEFHSEKRRWQKA